MRHVLTVVMTLAVGRIINKALDEKNWEVIILGIIIIIGIGIFTYLLAKKGVK